MSLMDQKMLGIIWLADLPTLDRVFQMVYIAFLSQRLHIDIDYSFLSLTPALLMPFYSLGQSSEIHFL